MALAAFNREMCSWVSGEIRSLDQVPLVARKKLFELASNAFEEALNAAKGKNGDSTENRRLSLISNIIIGNWSAELNRK